MPYLSNNKAGTFDHERLDVYQLQLHFIAWVTPLIEESKSVSCSKASEVCQQLDRASLSCLLKTAEGNGKRRIQVRARFFDDARGSATECAACLDALVAKAVVSSERIPGGKEMLFRIVSMLCGLVNRFDQREARFREDTIGYRVNGSENRERGRGRGRKVEK
jgi:four helix bundle protein